MPKNTCSSLVFWSMILASFKRPCVRKLLSGSCFIDFQVEKFTPLDPEKVTFADDLFEFVIYVLLLV